MRVAAGAYLLLSAACFAVDDVPALLSAVQANTSALWLLGPPILLMYRMGLLWVYAGGTLVFAGLAATVYAASRRSLASLLFGSLAILTWIASGLFVYVPSW